MAASLQPPPTNANPKLREYLKLMDITEFVVATVCGDEVAHEKPAPDLIEAARKLPAPHRRLIAVGDTPYDARAAKRAL